MEYAETRERFFEGLSLCVIRIRNEHVLGKWRGFWNTLGRWLRLGWDALCLWFSSGSPPPLHKTYFDMRKVEGRQNRDEGYVQITVGIHNTV